MGHLKANLSLDDLNSRIGDNLPGHLGIQITGFSEGEMTARMELKSIHFAPNTYLHAGSIVTLADTTAGFAAYAHLPEGSSSFTTIELKSNFLGTLRQGAIICVAKAQHLGRHTQVWDAEVFDEATQRKMALFRCTQMVLWPKE